MQGPRFGPRPLLHDTTRLGLALPNVVSISPDDGLRERSLSRRAERWDALHVLWDESELPRVRKCGRVSVRHDGSAAIRVSESNGAGYAGLATCGSVWACPVCSAKIAATRQQEIETAATWWEHHGGALAMGTFTVAHKVYNSLASVWDAVAAGWHSITSGRAWKRNCATFGVEGWIRIVEVTHGEHGWHVHVHVLFFLHHGLMPVERAALTAALLGRWQTGIGKHGFTASGVHGARLEMAHGTDAARVLSDYFTKGVYSADGSAPRVVGLEMARGDLKETRAGGSRTPFRILRDFYTDGDLDDLELWHEWERGSKGRRQSAWSKGLRDVCRLTRERTDDEIVAEELGSALDDVVVLPAETVRATAYQRAELLRVAQVDGADAVRKWLDRRGHVWHDPAQLRR